jgi:transcriptional regulator with XRE-family HTH domain
MTRLLGQGRELQVLGDPNNVTNLAERLARARRTYGDHIDLPNLGRVAFATLLGVSTSAYEAYERGERMPTVDFLAVLYAKTGIILEQLRSPNELPFSPGAGRRNSGDASSR